jgi:pilus assembly protein CpaD
MAKKTFAFLMLGTAALAGGPALARERGVTNPSLNSVNQPVVQQTNYVLDVRTSGSGLDAGELGRLGEWFRSLQLGYGDGVSVDAGSAYGDDRIRQDVAAAAGAYGLLVAPGTPVTTGSVQPGYARVVVTRSEASVLGCPNWAYAGHVGAPITTDSNYGCATNSNLAAMIANPADLVLGQASSGLSDPRESTKAIESYRKRVMTGFEGGGLKSEKVGKK